ncbi:subclass B1 metallo-beta-lactamase [Rubrivirga sp.]|uniref:subclass B1 metallo-beta-lactamase n=1 Tax=Rubrivirga sp. TaxID=1885344 RepID=UPI003C725F0E
MRAVLALVVLSCSGCVATSEPVAPEPIPGLEVEALTPTVWVHTTARDVEGFGRVLSNGLVVASGSDALLVDTAWGDDPEQATASLLAELRLLWGAGVRRAVVSHHHDDSVGGVPTLRRAGIPIVATSRTADRMEAEGWPRPDFLLEGGDAWTLRIGDPGSGPGQVLEVEVFDAGSGHTVDNVVVYVPSAGILYGGCLIRPGGSTSLGNTADADLERWAESVARVRDRYPDLEVVVPSHGPPGGPELLDQTISLVESHRGRPVGE